MEFLKPLRSQLKLWEKLDQAKIRRREGLFLAEGFKIVDTLLKSTWKTRAVLVMEEKKEHWKTGMPVLQRQIDIFEVSRKDWKKLSQDREPEGIMAVAAVPEPPRLEDFLTDVQGHLLLLYRLNNPNNLGAIMRSAHWFGFAGIILSRDSVDFTHPKVVRASMGSIFYLSLIADAEFAEILPRLKERYRLAGSDVRIGVPPHVCAKPTALLMGSESHGLPDDLSGMADEIWRIPGTGGAESLSLPQAAAVLMYACTVSS